MSKKLKAITNTPVRFPFTATALLFFLLDYYQSPGWVVGVSATLVVLLFVVLVYIRFNTEYVDIFKYPIEPTVKTSSFQEKLEQKLKERSN